ncbi:hypothetical protein [Streptomyces virginiae]|uniref:hypothetical protein n=1 Tax=Streptomyces virginiae TaxID=1961 RepID=UPI002DBF5F50|nr:hypothetical protein [Streptomyces sp. CMAA1738]MEC4570232.1 hypothetical protein [Streptomyces sp. CMAA1738]
MAGKLDSALVAQVHALKAAAALDDVERIESNGRGRPLVPRYEDGGAAELSAWQEAAAAAVPDVDGSGVVLGIIDSGIDIHHAAFRKDGHTSITALVDFTLCQTVRATEHLTAPGMTLKWNPPKTPLVESAREVVLTSTFPTTSADVEQAWLSVTPEIGPGDVRVTGGPFPANPLTIRFGGKYLVDTTPDGPGSAG